MQVFNNKEWIEVEAIFGERPEDWSVYADAYTEAGCPGTLQNDDPPKLSGYLQNVPGGWEAASRLSLRLLELGAKDVMITTIPDLDWSNLWKIHFKPQRVGKHLMIVPSWESIEIQTRDVVIQLDPGQAFGTGEHPTSRLCLELLEREDLLGKSVLDLGCGSGILAIAAVKLGASEVTAVDIEPAAVEIARENALLNKVELELHAHAGFGDWARRRKWDVIVSNIISATLIRLAGEAREHLVDGGRWMLSGVLEENWKDVLAACEAAGFEVKIHEVRDQWVGAVLRART